MQNFLPGASVPQKTELSPRGQYDQIPEALS